jgi:glycosyltransferase involved in cell wall biosynthesis
MNKLSFSVIVPVYNGQKYLRETLESAVNQDYSASEIIAVDDGSNDSSAEIIQSFESIKYIYQENQGNAVARNRGIALSTGDVIALIDQDDKWVPEKLSTFYEYFSAHPAIDFATAKHRMFLSDDIEVPAWCRDDVLNRDIVDYSPGSLVFRRRLFDRIGPFDQSLVSGHDTDWVLRVKDSNTPMAVLPDVLLLKRIHEANQSFEVTRIHSELLEVFRRSINRNKGKTLE